MRSGRPVLRLRVSGADTGFAGDGRHGRAVRGQPGAAAGRHAGRLHGRGRQLEATLGYGLALPGGYVGMPEVGFVLSGTGRELRTAWRVNLAGGGGLSVAFSLEAARRTGAATERDVEDRIGAGLNVRW